MARRARPRKRSGRFRFFGGRLFSGRRSPATPAGLLVILILLIGILVIVSRQAYHNKLRIQNGGSPEEVAKSNVPRIVLRPDDPAIDVLITGFEQASELQFSCASGWEARDGSGRVVATTASAAATTVVAGSGGRLLLRGGDAGKILHISGGDGAPMRLGKSSYYGKVEVTARGRGLRVVNTVSLEQYLASVVGSEMYASSTPAAALEAQAIAARTYARFAIEDRRRTPLPDSQEAQAYYGIGRETAATRAAVLATRSKILTWNGVTLPAYYHSTCGGRTIDGAALHGSPVPPPLRGVPCGYCETGKLYRWSASLKLKNLAAMGGDLGIGRQVFKVEPRGTDEEPWSRIYLLGDVAARTIEARTFRNSAMKHGGGMSMPSPFLTDIETTRDGLTIRGRGFGHGVGLCQVGAAGMARAGADAMQILDHYYPGAQVGVPEPQIANRSK